MNREEARQYIIERGKDHLTPDKSGKGFICPICGSGSGRKGTGITTKGGMLHLRRYYRHYRLRNGSNGL